MSDVPSHEKKGGMILPILLLATPLEHTPDPQPAVSFALTSLNNYLEAISFSDACLHRSDMKALEPLQDRIEQVRRRAMTTYPALTGTERAGDTDYVCHRTSEPPHVSKRAMKREGSRLLSETEAALARESASVR